MQSRFVIVLVSVVGAGALFGLGLLFGLGVMSSPPAAHHKEIAIDATPTKVARQETTGETRHDDDRALTPLYPVTPGAPAAAQDKGGSAQPAPTNGNQGPAPHPTQQDTEARASPLQNGAGPMQPAQMSGDQRPAPQPTPKADQTAKTPKAEAAVAAAPKAPAPPVTPASAQNRNACDIDACSRAYHSFRESDCTYQPYSGPRQLCVDPPSAQEASRSQDHDRIRSRVDVHDARHEMEQTMDGRAPPDDQGVVVLRSYRRDFSNDAGDDRIVAPADADGDWGGDADDQ